MLSRTHTHSPNRLVVQRTKRIDETQELLLEMLEDLTSGTNQERQEFMAVCVETLTKFRKDDMITPVFLFERLSNIIHPVRFSKVQDSMYHTLSRF